MGLSARCVSNAVRMAREGYPLPYELVKLVFDSSADFRELEKETWYGLHTYITDGTYLQLQDTQAIRSCYPHQWKETACFLNLFCMSLSAKVQGN
jgi:hypothetical protein